MRCVKPCWQFVKHGKTMLAHVGGFVWTGFRGNKWHEKASLLDDRPAYRHQASFTEASQGLPRLIRTTRCQAFLEMQAVPRIGFLS